MLKYLLAAVAAITVVASAHAAEDEVREAAPIGLVGEPWPPGSEQQDTVWMDPSPVITWAKPEQLTGGVPSYMPAGHGVTTVPVSWADNSALLPTPNPLKANASQLPAQNCPQPTAGRDAFYCNPNQQQANTAAIKEDALAAKDAAVLSARAEAKPKRTRKH